MTHESRRRGGGGVLWEGQKFAPRAGDEKLTARSGASRLMEPIVQLSCTRRWWGGGGGGGRGEWGAGAVEALAVTVRTDSPPHPPTPPYPTSSPDGVPISHRTLAGRSGPMGELGLEELAAGFGEVREGGGGGGGEWGSGGVRR